MYNPVKDGIEKAVKSVVYNEAKPPSHLSELVHCFWELKTETVLSEDFFYHVLPDACVNILFNQVDLKIAAITALQTTYKVLNLGKDFHFVGVQLLPGVWRGNDMEIKNDLVDQPYDGILDLVDVNNQLFNLDFESQQLIFSRFVEYLFNQKILEKNSITEIILSNFTEIQNVADMARFSGLSCRQLQRILKKTTGFLPHDFLKVLRIQQSFNKNYLDYYTDQSHFIHSFRKITGYTPTNYNKKFDV
jgi:AraC-like DNA-binding protein